jgi:hypothetical protein
MARLSGNITVVMLPERPGGSPPPKARPETGVLPDALRWGRDRAGVAPCRGGLAPLALEASGAAREAPRLAFDPSSARPPTPARPRKATRFTHLKTGRGPLPQLAGEEPALGLDPRVARSAGWGVARCCGANPCTNATPNLQVKAPCFPHPIRPPATLGSSPRAGSSPASWGRNRAPFEMCEYRSPQGGRDCARPVHPTRSA